MPRKTKKSDPTRWKREILGVLMAATGGFTLVALWPWDPGWHRTPETLNRVGILGSYSAFYLYRAFGLGALALAGGLVVYGILLLFDRVTRKAFVLGLSALATMGVLLALFGVADAWMAGPSPWAGRGGLLGRAAAGGLIEVVGLAGALMFCLVAMLVLAVATFQLSLADTVEAGLEAGVAGGRRARAGFDRMGERVARWGGDRRAPDAAELEAEAGPQAPLAPPGPERVVPPDPAAATAARPSAPRGRSRGGAPADGWIPPLSLLEPSAPADSGQSAEDLDQLGRVLIEKLRSFHVEGEIVAIHSGPVLTQFEVKPAPGVKVNQIANLADDLALAMRAQRIRIVAPIPGKGAVGIEIPNPRP
ncbi:MAG: DNA translocase FtsK 4TM domain-containing protein, partial [Gemmatimonadota bacterium]